MSVARILPPSVTDAVTRPRLFRRLDRTRSRPLTWVSGPQGSGKTTLVASYLAARRCHHLWYRVDETDQDVATFFYYLARAAPNLRRPAAALHP
jgi:ATP/maltotriose-dependent transcriptional regulator MalT